MMQKQPLNEIDQVHSSLLDQYSRDSGRPRESVSQHDPGFEAWLRAKSLTDPAPVGSTPSLSLPINISLEMSAPATIPTPDYTRSDTQLGAWEQANFLLLVQQFFSCDKIVNNGTESSFVTDIGVRFARAGFEYFIARHIFENMNDPNRQKGERNTWRLIHRRIRIHAREHFVRYRKVVDTMRQDFLQRFSTLPNRNNPIQIPQQDLEAYVGSLLQYLEARLHFELWQTTCEWERTDYPTLLDGIPNVKGSFVPACGSSPRLPPEPTLPIVVTSSPGRS